MVKAKYKSIRTQYVKECNKVEKSKRSGAGSDEVYRPSWSWFPVLSFMRHTVQPEKTQGSQMPPSKPSMSTISYKSATNASVSKYISIPCIFYIAL